MCSFRTRLKSSKSNASGLLCLHAGNSVLEAFICPVLKMSSDLVEMSTMTRDELIRFWRTKVRGHCDLTKHIFGHNLIIHTVFTIEIDIRMSNRIKCQRLNALWRHKILIIDVLAIIHHHSSGDDHDTVTLVWIFLHRLHQHVFTDLVSETCWVSSLIAGCVIRRWTVG